MRVHVGIVTACLLALLASSAAAMTTGAATLPYPDGCTAIAVSPGASIENAAMTTHTNDCKDCDFRLSINPRKYHRRGDVRELEPARFDYPRYLGYDKGPQFYPENLQEGIYPWNDTFSVGTIPQGPVSYQYLEGGYGIINEHQLAMGESTCSAVFVAAPKFAGGHAEVDISVLGRIALERTQTARDACALMGMLGEKYGYYGAEWTGAMAMMEAGEGLTVCDPKECWIFHILPDDEGRSAVWAAQRVPDGHVAVIANDFIIQELDYERDDQMFSKNAHDIARATGLWDGKGLLNFAKSFGHGHPFEQYCSRRVWRVFDLVAPSLQLNGEATLAELPFSVKPDAKISYRDVMAMNRDHYEGSKYDLTKGMAAGPYGNPNRYDRGTGSGETMDLLMKGMFERPISMFRTSYSYVTMSRSHLPDAVGATVWFGPAAPHSTVYTPLYPFANSLPAAYMEGSLYQLDHRSAWWASTAVQNYAERMFMYIQQDVTALQAKLEEGHRAQQVAMEEKAAALWSQGQQNEVAALLTESHVKWGQESAETWWKLFYHLITKYHDGYRVDDWHQESFNPTGMFYPLWWLEEVGFFENKPLINRTESPPSLPHPRKQHSAVQSSNAAVISTAPEAAADTSACYGSPLSTATWAVLLVVTGVVSFAAGRHTARKEEGEVFTGTANFEE